jgi:transposase
MAWKIRLTSQERCRLQEITRSARESSQARLRATVILMSAQGVVAQAIASALGMGIRTVYLTRRRWRRKAFDGLDDAPRSGRPPRATRGYLRKLVRTVETDPRDLGYVFTRWTCAKLAEYMRQQTGIDLCPDWVGVLLKRQGFVWRKSKLTTRNLQDPRGKKAGPEMAAQASECGAAAVCGF